MSLVDPVAGKSSISKKDKPTGGVKLKKSIAKKTKHRDTLSNGESRPNQLHLLSSHHFSKLQCTRDEDGWDFAKPFPRISSRKRHGTESWRQSGPHQVQLLQETLARVRRRFSCPTVR